MLCLSDLICMYLAFYAQSGGRFRTPPPDLNFEGLAGAGLGSRLFVDEFFRIPGPGEEDWRDPLAPEWEHTEGLLISRGNQRFVRSVADGREIPMQGNVLVEVDAIPEEGFVHLLTGTCFTGWKELVTANDDSFGLMAAFADNYGKAYCLIDYAGLTEDQRIPVAGLLSDADGAESLFRCLCSAASVLSSLPIPGEAQSLRELTERHNRHYGARWPVTPEQIRVLLEVSGLEDTGRGHSMFTLLACWDAFYNRKTGDRDITRSGLVRRADFRACMRRITNPFPEEA